MDKKYWLNLFTKAKKVDKFSYIVEYCKEMKVLDVGCIGQDKSADSDEWLHRKIKDVASKLVGVDIQESEIQRMKESGYEMYTPTSIIGMEGEFDLVVMGDVLEHVESPGEFLSFYAKFLNHNGKMIICTPNAFGIRYTLQVFLYGVPGTNEEHTCTFDPYVMLELLDRVGLEPESFLWLKEYRKGANWKQKIILGISSVFIGIRRFFNANFMFIVKQK